MPWTVDSVEKHRKGLKASQKKKWVRIANGRLKACLSEGGSEKECAGSAIKIANSFFERDGKRKR